MTLLLYENQEELNLKEARKNPAEVIYTYGLRYFDGPDCLGSYHPKRCRRYLKDLREYLDRWFIEDAETWACFDQYCNSDDEVDQVALTWALDAICELERTYLNSLKDVDKAWFDRRFRFEAENLRDGEYVMVFDDRIWLSFGEGKEFHP